MQDLYQQRPDECANDDKPFHTAFSTTADEIEEQTDRCSKYSQQAIGFAISTFSGFLVSESYSSTGGPVAVKVAVLSAFFVAIVANLISWKMKPAWGTVLVYISSFHLLLMTLLIFISDKAYGNCDDALFVILIIGAIILLQHKLWPDRVWRGSTDNNEEVSQDRLDSTFDLAALILNWDSVLTIIRHFSSGPNKCVAASAAGLLFFSTIMLSIYLMMVSTVRTKALSVVHVEHLDSVLIVLLVSAFISTAITFLYFPDKATEWEVPT